MNFSLCSGNMTSLSQRKKTLPAPCAHLSARKTCTQKLCNFIMLGFDNSLEILITEVASSWEQNKWQFREKGAESGLSESKGSNMEKKGTESSTGLSGFKLRGEI